MDRIDSKDNPRLIAAAKLKEGKYRAASGCYLVEGEKMVREALAAGADIERIYLRESEAARYNFVPDALGCIVADRAFSKLCDTVTPQGIAAVVRLPDTSLRPPSGNCLILDGIRDAGNLGTILRTAAATGIADVYLTDCVDTFNPKCVRSSMSGIFYVRPMPAQRNQALAAARQSGLTVTVADMAGEDLFTASKEPFALVIGSEAHGVSEFFRSHADRTVKLAMQNVESLNAAVCAGVMMYVLTNPAK